ncbi:hypothetical protein QQP08_021780 [Theobroma cacao]|nr:hypothetical protein QQP08_021780 [Theobroma cacao]
MGEFEKGQRSPLSNVPSARGRMGRTSRLKEFSCDKQRSLNQLLQDGFGSSFGLGLSQGKHLSGDEASGPLEEIKIENGNHAHFENAKSSKVYKEKRLKKFLHLVRLKSLGDYMIILLWPKCVREQLSCGLVKAVYTQQRLDAEEQISKQVSNKARDKGLIEKIRGTMEQ